MLSTTFGLGKKDYYLIGRLLFSKNPELAQELVKEYHPTVTPAETDLSKISELFVVFCQLRGIKPGDHTGSLYKSSKVDIRRVFIATILHLYCPQVYLNQFNEKGSHIVKKGLVRSLGKVLNQNESNISIRIREAIQWEKNYDDFKSEVFNILDQIPRGREARPILPL